jgi:non-specific serine/threonine protein kinase
VLRGQLQEGRARLETLLARSEGSDRSVTRGAAEYGGGLLAWAQGDLTAAERWAEAAIVTTQATGNKACLSLAHALLGMVRISQGDAQGARAFLEESRAAFHEAGGRQEEGYMLYWLARAALLDGDFPEAQRLAQESLALFQQSTDELGRAWALGVLGIVALAHGDSATAVARFEEVLPFYRATGGLYFLADTQVEAGTAWMEQGDLEQAQHLLTESLSLWRDMRRPEGVALALAGLSEVAAAQGRPRRAARLLGAAEALHPAGGPHRPPYLQALVDRAVASARDALGAEAFETAQAEGAGLSEEEAIAEALEETTPGERVAGAHN